jgi:hypothetical protein
VEESTCHPSLGRIRPCVTGWEGRLTCPDQGGSLLSDKTQTSRRSHDDQISVTPLWMAGPPRPRVYVLRGHELSISPAEWLSKEKCITIALEGSTWRITLVATYGVQSNETDSSFLPCVGRALHAGQAVFRSVGYVGKGGEKLVRVGYLKWISPESAENNATQLNSTQERNQSRSTRTQQGRNPSVT